ncbi:MAG: hypothetical protein AAF449_01145, partial [Myxococcota bacterium]
MSEDAEHRSPVLAGLTSAHRLVPVQPWEGSIAAICGCIAGATLGFGVFGAAVVGGAVLGVLLLWKRQDHHRNDYLSAWWRRRFVTRAYDLHGPDEFYRPLEDLPSGFRLAVARGEGRRTMMSVRTFVDRLTTGMGLRPSPLSEQVPLWDVIEDEEGAAVLITPAAVAVI